MGVEFFYVKINNVFRSQNVLLLMFLSVFTAHAKNAQAQTLTLDEYTKQVVAHSHALKRSSKQIEISQENIKGFGQATAPQLVSNATILRDRQPPQGFPSYSALNAETFGIGVEQQFNTGTKAAVNVEWQNSKLIDMTPAPGVPSSDVDGGQFVPSISVSQSLWQNRFGSHLKLQEETLRQLEYSSKYAHESQEKLIGLEAKLTYLNLLFAKDRLNLTKKTLRNAEKIFDYVDSRFKKSLAEKSDLLQAQALVSARRYELQRVESDVQNAATNFNFLRGSTSNTVQESIESMRTIAAEEDITPVITSRSELKNIEAQIQLVSVSAQLEADKAKPSLEAFVKYSMKSNQSDLAEATAKVIDPYHPQTAIGVSLRMPLNADLAQSSTRVAILQREALNQQLEETKQAFYKDIQSLSEKLAMAKKSFAIAKQLEEIQKSRVQNEQKEFRNGRSTTYQNLLAIQDLSQAELGRLQVEFEITALKTQLALYKRDAQ
jgi:outer membrane protein TolC